MSAPRSWTLEHPIRPLPENELRKLFWRKRAEYVSAWRFTFKMLAKAKRVPKLDVVLVTAVQVCREGTPLPDPGANFNTAKAAIDGLVDARVIPDDTVEHIEAIVLARPVYGDHDRFLILVEEVLPEGAA